MKATEETLRAYLKVLKVKEKDFCQRLDMTLPTIAAAIDYARSKPENGDWKLIYKIKSFYTNFEIEHFDANSTKKRVTEKGKSINTSVHSEEFEKYFKIHTGTRLKSLRTSRNYSAKEMSAAIGVNVPNYSALETGRTHLSCYRLHLACTKLNVSYQAIINIDGKENDPRSLELLVVQKDEMIRDLQSKLQISQENELKYKQLLGDIQSKIKNA